MHGFTNNNDSYKDSNISDLLEPFYVSGTMLSFT